MLARGRRSRTQGKRIRGLVGASWVALAGCVAAPASGEPNATAHALSSGRLTSLVGALLGLAGLVLGYRALARSSESSRASRGPGKASAATVAGLIGAGVGGFVVTRSAGGLGTGNGLGGAIVAIVLGLSAALLGGLSLARARRQTSARARAMTRRCRRPRANG